MYAQSCDSQATAPSKADRRYMNPRSPRRLLKSISFHHVDYFVSELNNHPNLGLIFCWIAGLTNPGFLKFFLQPYTAEIIQSPGE